MIQPSSLLHQRQMHANTAVTAPVEAGNGGRPEDERTERMVSVW